MSTLSVFAESHLDTGNAGGFPLPEGEMWPSRTLLPAHGADSEASLSINNICEVYSWREKLNFCFFLATLSNEIQP